MEADSLKGLTIGENRDRRWIAAVVAFATVLSAVVLWRVLPSDDVAEQAPLITPVIYGEGITRLVDPQVGVAVEDADERSCLLERLSGDSALVAALGEHPRESPRFRELERLRDECTAVADTERRVGAALTKVGADELSETQLSCVADALMAYPADDRDRVLSSDVVRTPMGPLRDRVRELLAVCGIDNSIVQ